MYLTNGDKMKKAILVILASATLVGCGTRTVIVEATTPESTNPPVTDYQSKGGVDGYFNAVMEAFPNAVNIHGRKWIVEFGEIACGAIDEGMSLNELLNMVPASADSALIGYMVRHAILNICPHNQWFLDAAAQA
jgi:hypothetical protein